MSRVSPRYRYAVRLIREGVYAAQCALDDGSPPQAASLMTSVAEQIATFLRGLPSESSPEIRATVRGRVAVARGLLHRIKTEPRPASALALADAALVLLDAAYQACRTLAEEPKS